MVKLVTLAQASASLRRDQTVDDALLELHIAGASRAVLRYLKDGAYFLNSTGEPDYDSAGDPLGVPEDVQLATLLLVGEFYDNTRDGGKAESWPDGYLPPAVKNLLYPLRTPTVE